MQKHSTKTAKATNKPTRKQRAKQKDPAEAKFEAEFGRGLHEFAGQAYTEALDYYSKHYNNPAALDALQIRNPGPIHTEWVELSNAIAVIATCEFAPWSLKQPVIDFLSSESGGIWNDLMVRTPVIQRILVAAKCRQEEVTDDEN